MTVRCKKCGENNPEEYRYCDNCGAVLTGEDVFKRGRYGALERIANGYRFVSRLIAAFGVIVAAGVFVYFWSKSILASFFFCITTGLLTYLATIGFRAVSEFLFLLLDIEDSARRIADKLTEKEVAEKKKHNKT